MQPTLVITAPAAGMVYINGRFLGEASPESPLFVPVHPFGPVYLEYRSLEPGFSPLARKLVLSSGAPMRDSLPEDVLVILWPDNITEIELAPAPQLSETTETASLDGASVSIVRGERSYIEIDGLRCPFPRTAQTPVLRRQNGVALLTGRVEDEEYILTLTGDLSRQTGFLKADRIAFESESVLRASVFRHDVAGHCTVERWRLNPAGLQLLSSESAWEDGAPRIPATAEETARAAVEAALLRLSDESDGYLSPELRARCSLDAIGEICSMCLPMKYGRPAGRDCVGLLQIETGSCAGVRPLYYSAVRTDSRWMLTELTLDDY